MEVIKKLTRSRKFWLTVFALVQTLVFASIPNFNSDVWKAIDGLVMVLITMIAVEDSAATLSGKQ